MARLEPARERTVDGEVVLAAYEHLGPARTLVHRLKYEGIRSAVSVFGPRLLQLIDFPVDVVTFVPRVTLRRWYYGIDQSHELARVVGSGLGVPVVRALESGWWTPPSAGALKADRRIPRFAGSPDRMPTKVASCLVIDDVLTTGATVGAATRKIREIFRGNVRSVVATSASEVTSLRARR